MQQAQVDWALEIVGAAAKRRAWRQLPENFEIQAVKRAYQTIKPAFDKSDIQQRIAASKAITFDELQVAVASARREA